MTHRQAPHSSHSTFRIHFLPLYFLPAALFSRLLNAADKRPPIAPGRNMAPPPPAPPLPFAPVRPSGGIAAPPLPPSHPVHARVPSKLPESIPDASSPSSPPSNPDDRNELVLSKVPQSTSGHFSSSPSPPRPAHSRAPSKLPSSLVSRELTPSAPPFTPSAPSSPEPSDGPIPRLPIMLSPHPFSRRVRSSSSSPRRPRRAGTGLPHLSHHTSVSDFELGESASGDRPARDEFEEEFLAQGVAEHDVEGKLINSHLERVDFRQLDDDEEVLSESGSPSEKNQQEKKSPAQAMKKAKQSTVRSDWKRIPTEVGCAGCAGCARLCGENRRLRRQMDELEFELASGVLHNPADGFDPPAVMSAVPILPQIPVSAKRKRGWGSKMKNPTIASLNGAKASEKERLKSKVNALTVTTEYLWRKLNMAEMELRTYRLKDLRNRMKLTRTLK
ncbi:unnamed protein product [Chondrus crispus]|uniref:4Fe-4S ferredoxin-type domain-containing protein n=1 Tax=Chondrus crispus TaxID=2769 RepID=R7QEG6_CHOCR|nr:unnamed protein product [Chondrus crispus]CDF35846.1 unnamed protein product [Chondrus crispus]|eukprot:XP_005715665.1 unnamed protein product [Chondrus crispus]